MVLAQNQTQWSRTDMLVKVHSLQTGKSSLPAKHLTQRTQKSKHREKKQTHFLKRL